MPAIKSDDKKVTIKNKVNLCIFMKIPVDVSVDVNGCFDAS